MTPISGPGRTREVSRPLDPGSCADRRRSVAVWLFTPPSLLNPQSRFLLQPPAPPAGGSLFPLVGQASRLSRLGQTGETPVPRLRGQRREGRWPASADSS